VNILTSAMSGFVTLTTAAVAVEATPFLTMTKYHATFSEPLGDGYFVVLHWHLWPTLCVSVLAFSAGFVWQHRRSR
jgi:hypothetical protein